MPYGFPVDGNGNRLEPNEQEQAVIAGVRYLRESGYTTRQIALELNAQGFTTRKGTAWRFEYLAGLLRTSAVA